MVAVAAVGAVVRVRVAVRVEEARVRWRGKAVARAVREAAVRAEAVRVAVAAVATAVRVEEARVRVATAARTRNGVLERLSPARSRRSACIDPSCRPSRDGRCRYCQSTAPTCRPAARTCGTLACTTTQRRTRGARGQSPRERATRPAMSAESASAEIERQGGGEAAAEGLAEGAAGAEPRQLARACGGVRTHLRGDSHDARPQRAHGGRRGGCRHELGTPIWPWLFLPKHLTDLSSSSAHVWDTGTHRDARRAGRAVSCHARARPPTRERKERERRDRARQAAAAEEGAAPGQQAWHTAPHARTSEGDLHDARPKLLTAVGVVRSVVSPNPSRQ